MTKIKNVTPATIETASKTMTEGTPIVGTRRSSAAEKKLLAAKKKATIVEETDHNGTVVYSAEEEQAKAEAEALAKDPAEEQPSGKAIEAAIDAAHDIDDERTAQLLQDRIDIDRAVKAEEDGTNSTDAVALEIAHLLNDTDLDPTTKWASIVKLASSKIDETTITDLRLLSDTEIMRRLRLLWSKRVAAKKNNDLLALESIATDEAELQSHRTKTTAKRGSTVSADVDPTTLSQADLNKLIRNVQSKKCTAKKAGLVDDMAVFQAEEDKLKLLRTGEAAAPKGPSAMSSKITATIAALEALPQSEEIAAQIEMLKSLV